MLVIDTGPDVTTRLSEALRYLSKSFCSCLIMDVISVDGLVSMIGSMQFSNATRETFDKTVQGSATLRINLS